MPKKYPRSYVPQPTPSLLELLVMAGCLILVSALLYLFLNLIPEYLQHMTK